MMQQISISFISTLEYLSRQNFDSFELREFNSLDDNLLTRWIFLQEMYDRLTPIATNSYRAIYLTLLKINNSR